MSNWSDPASDPLGDLERAAEAYRTKRCECALCYHEPHTREEVIHEEGIRTEHEEREPGSESPVPTVDDVHSHRSEHRRGPAGRFAPTDGQDQ